MRKSSQQNVGAATVGNPMKTLKKQKKQTAVVDFEELTLFLGEDDPHLKIYFRRREDLKMRGFPPPSRQKEAM